MNVAHEVEVTRQVDPGTMPEPPVQPRRVLVTGAAGFIGRALVAALSARGHVTIELDKAWGSSTAAQSEGSLTPLQSVMRANIDVIVHLGASCSSQLSIRRPRLDFTDNVVGTFNVVEAARRHGNIPIIFNSTAKIRPGTDGKITPYGQSKRTGEDYLRLYRDVYGLPYIINRPSSVYGPGQIGSQDGGWIAHFMRCALTDQKIRLWVSPNNSRDILYIDDHVRLLVDQVEHFADYAGFSSGPFDSWGGEPAQTIGPVGEFWQGGGAENVVSIKDLLDWLNYRNYERVPTIAGDVPHMLCDNTAVSAVRGWIPAVHWRDGLARTMIWMRGTLEGHAGDR